MSISGRKDSASLFFRAGGEKHNILDRLFECIFPEERETEHVATLRSFKTKLSPEKVLRILSLFQRTERKSFY